MKKKGQMTLGSAPTVVLIVGLVFLVMATMAYVAENFGSALDDEDVAGTMTAEAVTQANLATAAGDALVVKGYEDGKCTITAVTNGSAGGALIRTGNYTEVSECAIKNLTSTYSTADWYVNYTYTSTVETVASNTTTSLNTEISNNTSIAGIVLTISLVGIVLSVLLGVFVAAKNRGL